MARGAALPDIGVNADEAAVFALPVGGVTAPITTPNGTVIARVAERADDREIAEGRAALREELVNSSHRFFSAYMAKAKTS